MKRLKQLWIRASVTLVTLLLVTSGLAAAPGYHVIKTYKLGGDGGWDYITFDPASNRLYISRSTHVIVIDADSGRPVGDILDTPACMASPWRRSSAAGSSATAAREP